MAQAAGRTSVYLQTLRYNDRRGLLHAGVVEVGVCRYGLEAVHKVQFVKRAEELGFTLGDADVLLDLAGGGPESCPAAVAMANEKIAALTAKVNDPARIRAALEQTPATRNRPPSRPRLHASACPGFRSLGTAMTRPATPRIQLLRVADCPLLDRVRDLVAQALAATGTAASVEELCGPYPSLTLLIDGVDLVTGRPPDPDANCRLTLLFC